MSAEKEAVFRLRDNLSRAIIGKEEVIEKLVVCLLAEGHVLVEDVPGVGKTTLARALARSMDATFGRVQFTPDTLPQDVTGASVYDMKTGEFYYRPGAAMHQILLADEINRTAPKTQASLLEAMAEMQVTVDGVRYPLPEPFFVIATQNPVEFLGTYPLPEAQLDRFMMRISIGYPGREDELDMAVRFLEGELSGGSEPVCGVEDILRARESVREIKIKQALLEYMEDIVVSTRTDANFALGASPRALLALVRASQARAYLADRDYVKPDDIREVVMPVLCHRLVLTPEAKIRGTDSYRALWSLVNALKIPL